VINNKKDRIHFIFDFDGTLVNSFSAVITLFNTLAERFKYNQLPLDAVAPLRELTSEDLMKKLKIPKYKLPRIIAEVRKRMSSEITQLPPFEHLPIILKQLRTLNVELSILSTNSVKNIKPWLSHYKMEDLFCYIQGGASFLGKRHLLQKMLNRLRIDKGKAYYIGDETRDIQASKACGVTSVAVTWGFNSENILKKCHPDFLVHKPEELLTIIDSIKI
jgi:phosphoglycolate phosphatase